MSNRDLYEVLGISRTATPDEIKSAYRSLARKFHPDVNPENPEAEERFKEIGAAYAVLSDDEKRAQYDRFGTTGDNDQYFNGAGGFQDIFDMFFGGAGQPQGRPRSAGRPGDDLRADVALNLAEVVTGAKKDVTVRKPTKCKACDGSGGEGGAAPETCATCQGSGMVSQVRNTFIGSVRTSTTCPSCSGEGSVIKSKCKTCSGRGLTIESASVSVDIPAGVETGATMHLPGKGGDGLRGGRNGDLYVVIEVKEDDRFEREGMTLHAWQDITFAQAALGDEVEITGVDGTYRLEVGAGSQPGSEAKIGGAGLPPLHGGRRGDLIVHLNISVPENLNETQREAIIKVAEAFGEKIPKEKSGSILSGLFKKKK